MIKNTKFEYKSEEYLEFRDITQDVEDFVKKSGINNGQVLVYSMHTTLAIRVNEKEAGIVKDFRGLIARLIPRDTYYCHNDLSIRTENLVCQSGASDCLNGHSHITHLLMGNSETLPIIDGKIVFGPWQRIFAIELDCGRTREIIFQVMGE